MKKAMSALAIVTALLGSSAAFAQWGDPCNGRIQGTWGYKGGRAMTLDLRRMGGDSVQVYLHQGNGSEALRGICRANRWGQASLRFGGGANNGNLTIERDGYVYGVVSNYSFSGQKY